MTEISMRMAKISLLAASLVVAGAGGAALLPASAVAGSAASNVAVGPQYGSTHVYVAPEDLDRFVVSFVATFGGAASKRIVATVTPTPSSTISQLVMTPVGMLSVFGYNTPIPYPFGQERTGYLVRDMDEAVRAARSAGAGVIVAPFDDAIGRDAVIQWPGGIDMQLYWHKTAPSYAALRTIPENRVYLSRDKADDFIHRFVKFAQGRVVSDDPSAPGIEIGRAEEIYRRVRIESAFGKMTALVTDGHLPYPYGHELAGYEVENLSDTLAKATAAGATLLVKPYNADHRDAAMVRFPGNYVAEIHAPGGN
jgi:hypothetical protein